MEDYLEHITESVRKSVKFPEKTIAHGFDGALDEGCIAEIGYDEDSSEDFIISAIDGGSNTIIKTPTFALVLNRVYCNKFDRMRKLDFFEPRHLYPAQGSSRRRIRSYLKLRPTRSRAHVP